LYNRGGNRPARAPHASARRTTVVYAGGNQVLADRLRQGHGASVEAFAKAEAGTHDRHATVPGYVQSWNPPFLP
jgi:hypothetical protein